MANKLKEKKFKKLSNALITLKKTKITYNTLYKDINNEDIIVTYLIPQAKKFYDQYPWKRNFNSKI
jgi:hypothetical protein